MLRDQTFFPMPIMGIGPETFIDLANIPNFDFATIKLFREHLLCVPTFKYAYLGLQPFKYGPNQSDFVKQLENFGVQFNVKLVTHVSEIWETRTAQEQASLCDFIYSPDFLLSLLTPNHVHVGNKDAFLRALQLFQFGAIPYSKELFKHHLLFH